MRKKLRKPLPIREILAKIDQGAAFEKEDPLISLQQKWERIVGPTLNRKSFPLKIHGRCLIVEVAGSAWANELDYLKSHLKERIQREIPNLSIEEIRFRVRSMSPVKPVHHEAG